MFLVARLQRIMNFKHAFSFGLALMVCGLSVSAQSPGSRRKPDKLERDEVVRFEGARMEIYKTIGDVKLAVHIFTPDGFKPDDRRPASVFFFGGGWVGGTPRQFEQQCRYLAARGMVAMTADYRVFNRHGTLAVKCVEDAKSAIRWVRVNAKRLGVDPDRIVAGGGSAGGHIAACAGVLEGFEADGENTIVSSVPNAMVLFNPALVLAPIAGKDESKSERFEKLTARLGTKPENLSPAHHVRPGVPPTLVQHGKADTTVPYWTVEAFAEAMKQAGNRCELIGYEGQQHGFFNFGHGGNERFIATTKKMDEFLVSLGYLKGPATVETFLNTAAPK